MNKITMTGYQVEGTPGRNAVENGRAEIDGKMLPLSAQVELYDLSAHADGDGLRCYVTEAVDKGAERIFAVHGDGHSCESLAEWARQQLGVEASAPEVGKEVPLGSHEDDG